MIAKLKFQHKTCTKLLQVLIREKFPLLCYQVLDIRTVILGHSERRAYFGENDAHLAEKVVNALDHDMDVIFCFGEELEDRKSGNHFEVVKSQIS